jgi:hypothetical protein
MKSHNTLPPDSKNIAWQQYAANALFATISSEDNRQKKKLLKTIGRD